MEIDGFCERRRRVQKWHGAFQIAFVYTGTVVGAGFATGKEIVAFFSQYGLLGFFGILLAGYALIVLGARMMETAIEVKAASYEDLTIFLFGKKAAILMNVIILIMLVGVSGVMISGTGALFEEHLNIKREAGMILTLFLTFLVMLIGTKGIVAVNVLVVPMMICFNLLLAVKSVSNPDFVSFFIAIPDNSFTDWWKSLISPFSYAAFNLTLAQAVLVPLAAEVNDKKIVRLGGMIGGFFLTIILLASHVALVSLPDFRLYDIPMAVIVKSGMAGLYFIYLFMIYGEIFTSIIGNIYGLEKQISHHLSLRKIWLVSIILIVVYMIGNVEYGPLLSWLYPFFGYISMFFLMLLWWKKPS